MSTPNTESPDKGYGKQLSEIIQGELVDLYGGSGYKSIMQTMVKIAVEKKKKLLQIMIYL